MVDEPKETRIPIMMPLRMVAAVDEWRRAQPDLPTRSEAIRRMIARALEQGETQ